MADLQQVELIRKGAAEWNKWRTLNLSEADLRRANLSGANLRQAVVGWTALGALDISVAKGLHTVKHGGPYEMPRSHPAPGIERMALSPERRAAIGSTGIQTGRNW